MPWLSLKDIRALSTKYVTETVDRPTMFGIDHSSARLLPRGTVALCRTASVGNVAILGTEMATSQDFVNWVCGSQLLPEYLYWSFRSSAATFAIEKQGSTHQTIYMPVVSRFHVLLPPLAEQRRIAELLDRAEALRAKRRASLARLDTFTQALFLDLFGDPATNPKGWATSFLGEVATFVGGGTPSRACPEYFTGTICWATSKDIKSEFLDDTEEHITEEAIGRSATKLVPAETILVVVKSKILAHTWRRSARA